MTLEMRRPISVRREHPEEPMIPDDSTATGTNSMFVTSWGYFRLFKFSSALDAEPGFKMVAFICLIGISGSFSIVAFILFKQNIVSYYLKLVVFSC